jgi:hypothetical protein
MRRARLIVLLGLVAAGCHLGKAPSTTLTSASIAPTRLRTEHAELARRLVAEEGIIDGLAASTDATEQRLLMNRIVVFFTVYVVEQGRAEEAEIFDPVDEHVGGSVRFTASLREAQATMARTVVELEQIAGSLHPDVARFVRQARDVIAQKRIQLEVEDRLVLPIFDRALTLQELGRAPAEERFASSG